MTTLLYILGLPRSGSTLLELSMAAHESVETVGELQVWPHEITDLVGVLPCGCGQMVSECEFWSGVRDRVDPMHQPPPRLDHFRETHYWGYTNRPGMFKQFGKAPLTSSVRRRVERYGQNSADLVEAIADQYSESSGVRPSVIVDASKDPYRALWLARSGQLDLRVVHLIRDPRGVVHSLTKDSPGPRPPSQIVVRRAMAWNLENLLAHRVLQNHVARDSWVCVRYEDMVDEPARTLGRVAEMCGVDPDPDASERSQSVAVHSIAGNPMRQQRRPVSLDATWETDMHPSARRTVSMLTASTRSLMNFRGAAGGWR